MPYSIETKDGIVINNIPDNVPHDSDELKARVAQIRSGNTQPSQPKAPVAQPIQKPSILSNAVSDLGNMISGAGTAVMHPIETTKGVLNLGAGELSKVLPKGVNEALNRADEAIMGKQQAQQLHAKQDVLANAINKEYAKNYGSAEGFKKQVQEHPLEVAADLSTVLTGAGALTKGSKLGNVLSKAGEITNPLEPVVETASALGKFPGAAAKQILGVTTGVGADTVGEAYKAGKAGNKVFMENLKGTAEPTKVLEEAQNALSNIKSARNEAYKASMSSLKNDKTMLGFEDVDKTLADTYKQFAQGEGGIVKNTKVKSVLDDVNEALNEWKNSDNPLTRTPQAFDDMKQRIGGILEGLPYNEKTARTAVNKVYNSIKNTIKAQAPTYEATMKDYSQASDLVNEIEKSLSLGDRASVDTAMRKLQSLTRNNVQTNYGQRVKLAKELEKYGGENIMPALAGQAMNEWLPRGLVGKGEDIAAILGAAHMSPATLAFPLAMPKVVGAGAYGAGKVAGAIDKLPITLNQKDKLALMLYQMQNANQGEE